MSMNNNSGQAKNVVGFPAHFVTPGPPPQLIHHHLSQAQQAGPSHFPGHFQLSEPQVQALAQSQYATAQAQAQMAQAQMAAPSPPPAAGSGVKRANPRPHARPPASNANAASPFKTMEVAPAARRKKQKLPESEKIIPEKVASLLPESALYTQLLEYEARIDAALARKKMDIQESFKASPQFQRTLRIYVFNTFSNQSETGGSDHPPTWSLRIIGRLLEDDKKEPLAAAIKFSSFFKKVTIYLDQKLYPENNVIAWESSRSPTLNDGFEVKRKGNKEFTVAIRLEMNYSPEKYKLSQPLSEALGGIEAETRARVAAAIWQYVKAKRLQVPGDPTSFFCDPPLKRVFGEDRVRFASVPPRLTQHLAPPQPIHIEHVIKLSGDSPAGTSCYDVLVDLPLRLEKEMRSFLANAEENKQIDSYDELISASIKKIHEHRRRRAFFLGFSQSPAEFINTLVASQSKDLKLVAGDSARDSEKERRSDFYNQPWADDAVIRYLNRKSTGTDAPGSI